MKKEFKDKWVAALRSGQYKKGKGKLCRSVNGKESHCCLGVALEVEGLAEKHVSFNVGEYRIDGSILVNSFDSATMARLGVDYHIQQKLVRFNDGNSGLKKAYSFNKIADWIEKNIKAEDA